MARVATGLTGSAGLVSRPDVGQNCSRGRLAPAEISSTPRETRTSRSRLAESRKVHRFGWLKSYSGSAKQSVFCRKSAFMALKPVDAREMPPKTLIFDQKLGVSYQRPGAFDEKPGVSGEKLRAFRQKLRAFDEKPGAFDRKLRAFDQKPRVLRKKLRAFSGGPMHAKGPKHTFFIGNHPSRLENILLFVGSVCV